MFDGDGKYLRQIKISEPFDYANTVPIIGNKPPVDLVGTMGPGAPWTVCITPGPNQVLYASDAFPGRVYKISLDGKVLGKLGGTGRQLKQFGWIHEIACPSENEIYVGRIAELAHAEAHPASHEVGEKQTRNISRCPAGERKGLYTNFHYYCGPRRSIWMDSWLCRLSRENSYRKSEVRMKRFALIVLAVMLFAPAWLRAQQAAPEIKFDSTANLLKLPPDLYLGEASGVATNSKGHIFVFSRGNSIGRAYAASAAQLLEFDKDGKFIREIGHNLYAWSFAHTVRVDTEDHSGPRRNSDMVIKFSPDGRVAMVFGRKQEASDEGTEPLKHPHPPLPPVDGMFRQVTDVTWDAEGDAFISDGYINSRVGKVRQTWPLAQVLR